MNVYEEAIYTYKSMCGRKRGININNISLITHNNKTFNLSLFSTDTIIRFPIYRLDDLVNKSYNHKKIF